MRRALALPVLGLLAACAAAGTQAVWLKPGTPALQAERDYLSCEAQARRDFPPDARLTVTPRISVGIGAGRCRDGFCYGVSNAAPVIRERDASDALRARSVAACMAGAGYAEARLPRCQGAAAVLASQPFDARGLCAADGRVAAPR